MTARLDPARLRWYRESHFWTRETLAAKAGVSAATITKAENGQRNPSEKTLRALCEVLDCKPSDLMTGL